MSRRCYGRIAAEVPPSGGPDGWLRPGEVELEEVLVTPRRADVDVAGVALAWVPHWRLPMDRADDEPAVEEITAF